MRIKQVTLGADVEVPIAVRVPQKQRAPSSKEYHKYADGRDGRIFYIPKDLCSKEVVLTLSRSQLIKYSLKQKPRATPGKILPCVGVFEGTKQEPHQPKGWPDGYAIQEDNVALEFNVPVTTSATLFTSSIRHAMSLVRVLCEEKELLPGFKTASHTFEKDQLQTPQAQLFGCDPDQCAYTGGHDRPSPPDFGNMRSFGGHIHVGGNFNCPDFVAVLFIELALVCNLGLDNTFPKTDPRRQWYGRPGVYREKPYGIEYRSLSNKWLEYPDVVGSATHQMAKLLINTPPELIQRFFRQMEWARLHTLLLRGDSSDKHSKGNSEWKYVRTFYNNFIGAVQ